MPIYEFECKTCNNKKEVIQKYSDAPPICENDQTEMTRLISVGSFELKGTGWYQTDFKGK